MRLQGAISPRVEARLDEMLGHPETCPHGNPIDAETARRRPAGTRLSEMEAGLAGDDLPDHRGGRGGRRPALVPRGARADARRPRHDPGPQRIARLADARRPARPGDARSPAGGARPGPPRRGRPGALPPRPGPRRPRMTAPARPDRPEPDRPAPHRDRPDGAVQLPLRPAHRRHVHPAARGHRPGPRLDRLREGHPRRPALAGPALGRGPGGRRRGGARAVRAVSPDAAPAALRGGRRAPPRRGHGLPVLLHARGARRRPEGPGGGQAAAALRRPLRDADRRGAGRARGRGPARRAPLPGRRRASSASTTSSAATSSSTSPTSVATSSSSAATARRSTTSRSSSTTRRWRSATSSAARTTSRTRPSTSCCSGRSATRAPRSPTCRSSSTRTGPR